MFDFKSLKEIINTLQEDPELQESLVESAEWRNRPIRSVWEMVDVFPPGFYEATVNRIHTLLLSLGFEDTPALFQLADHLFADLYVEQPRIDTALL